MDSVNANATQLRRKSSPDVVSKLWRVIDGIDWQKNEKDLNQLLLNQMLSQLNIKFNDKTFGQIIANAIDDKLVVLEMDSNGFRYKPCFDRSVFDSSHDWYCFECHSIDANQSLMDCNTCFRVFHPKCLAESKTSDEFQCIYCLETKPNDNSLRINSVSSNELNKLLSFVMINIEISSLGTNIYEKYAIERSPKSEALIHQMMDLSDIKQKALNGDYLTLRQFVNHFKQFVHNYMVLVVDNRKKGLTDISVLEKMFTHEVSELSLCVDCYSISSDITTHVEDKPYEWFTHVCDPPHELVFAKYDKYPFWPSKVIGVNHHHNKYDVRFFDPPNFSRALVSVEKLRPIEGFVPEKDEDLTLPLELLERHKQKLKAKGVDFKRTVSKYVKSSAKKVSKRSLNAIPLKRKHSDDEVVVEQKKLKICEDI